VIKRRRTAYTLFELILAIALSATLLVLIGTAINLYLVRVDTSRERVEEAQLARSILAMIAADLRATAVFQPQDTSALSQLAASTAAFDVDEIDQPGSGSTAGSTGDSGSASSSSFGSGSSDSGSASSGVASAESTSEYQLGANGTIEELIVDISRLPRVDELMTPVATGTTATAQSGLPRPSDEKTIRYFVRQGDSIDPSSVAATSLDPEAQLRAGGLVRQEIDRAARMWAEQSGNQAVLESGQALVAPEVVHVQFRYFDGAEVSEYWDMRERNVLPAAVEVTIWLAKSTETGTQQSSAFSMSDLTSRAHQYQQTVYLPVTGSTGGSEGAASAADSQSGSAEEGDQS
jgi:type II secretory pathway pseudopilin PulG